MPSTLLEKAKKHSVGHRSLRTQPKMTAELEELAIAWARGEVTFAQASQATGKKGTSLYALLAVAIRRAAMAGRLKLKV